VSATEDSSVWLSSLFRAPPPPILVETLFPHFKEEFTASCYQRFLSELLYFMHCTFFHFPPFFPLFLASTRFPKIFCPSPPRRRDFLLFSGWIMCKDDALLAFSLPSLIRLFENSFVPLSEDAGLGRCHRNREYFSFLEALHRAFLMSVRDSSAGLFLPR